MDRVIHRPCSVSDRSSCDSGAIIIKLIIHTKYEGQHSPFDANSENKNFK